MNSGWAEQRKRFTEWYKGKYVPPPPNDPNSSVFIIFPGHYQKSAAAKVLTWLVAFWLDHWKWIITIGSAIIIAFLKR